MEDTHGSIEALPLPGAAASMRMWQLDDSRPADEAAFRKELLKSLPKLRRFAVNHCRSKADTDDLVQLTCERALVHWRQWSGCGSLDRWLISILVNACRDEARARAGKALYALDAIPEIAAGSSTVDSAYLQQIQGEVLRIPDLFRDVLWLVGCEGLSYRETAEILHVPIGTVMSRLNRARHLLQARLAGRGQAAAAGPPH
ncbi:MAG TPA: RNA polymerase sigma factor [Hyphomicrobiaceae bacterium]